ncbi:hypothetical protein T01_10761 [Trichinella spiralis]|uniref:Uncharacterized protein n=1 Tax=Trichinella spiralis TaxID=6334 RepID=A0A0V1B2D9_TRISP|nr:hypothetical protein T01_10761 [Trichinella spiralis]
MDYDFSVRFTRSGRVIQKPIVLHDADISDPETVRSISSLSAELMSEDKELEPFSKTEYTWIKKAVRYISFSNVLLVNEYLHVQKHNLVLDISLLSGLIFMPPYVAPTFKQTNLNWKPFLNIPCTSLLSSDVMPSQIQSAETDSRR